MQVSRSGSLDVAVFVPWPTMDRSSSLAIGYDARDAQNIFWLPPYIILMSLINLINAAC